ncbi:MAG: ATP-binding protein, partial [Actinomycetota bacterium]
MAIVSVVLGVSAVAVTLTVRGDLYQQLDSQLEKAVGGERDERLVPPEFSGLEEIDAAGEGPGVTSRPERLSNLYEAVVLPDGSVRVLFEPNLTDEETSAPLLDTDELVERVDTPFTAASADGGSGYRVLVTEIGGDQFLVRAAPLDDLDATVERLVLLQALAVGIVLAVLAAVAWWVIRLGIRPVRSMADAAQGIADGDLSKRVPEPTAEGTEAHVLAESLNKMLERIQDSFTEQERSEERLRQFLADASHELRTPITTIRGYAELYRHGGLSTGEQLDDAMRRTEEEAARVGRLVDEMRTLTELDEGRPLLRQRVDVRALLADIIADARIVAPDHDLRSALDGSAANRLVVVGDEDRLRQMLVNIVGNAVVHTPAGTVIDVGCAPVDGGVVVTVSDDGPGMEPEVASRVTERFFRADPSRSRSRGGSGLGLSIAGAVASAHGGSIDVRSVHGRG